MIKAFGYAFIVALLAGVIYWMKQHVKVVK